MDSLSQFALGAAIGVVVMRRRTAPWKAVLIGGIVATLPDLDAFYDHGDPVSNMTLHRANSHSLLWLTLASPLVAALVAFALRERQNFKPWWLAVWLALFTHPLLDWFTVYGTQLLRPFTDYPFAIGSIFIIDPLYTLPLLIGIGAALIWRNDKGWRWASYGLAISTLYLIWSVAAQAYITHTAWNSLRADSYKVRRLLVTPTAFNTLLWRVVVVTPEGFLEGYRSIFDRGVMSFDQFPRGEALYDELKGNHAAARIAWFSHGFFKVSERGDKLVITDLRMGQEPWYTFNFVVAQRGNPSVTPVHPVHVREQPNIREGLSWLWRRALGEDLPPPR